MPIDFPSTYPSVQDAMILARSLVNDTFPGANDVPGEGQILTNDSSVSPFTIPFLNSAIRKVYRALGNSGVATLIQDNVILSNLGPVVGASGVGIPDPAIQVSVTFAGYFNGQTLDATKQLPANTLSVLKLWERTNGTGNPFTEMVQAQFGLPSRNQITYLGDWEYRQDGIFMVGCVNATDIRMRLNIALAGQISGDGTDFSSIFIPIQDSIDAIAQNVAALYSEARGADAAEGLMQMAQETTLELANRQIRQKQSVPYNRAGYDSGSGSGSGGWGNTGSW